MIKRSKGTRTFTAYDSCLRSHIQLCIEYQGDGVFNYSLNTYTEHVPLTRAEFIAAINTYW